jgi:hypothetical protein
MAELRSSQGDIGVCKEVCSKARAYKFVETKGSFSTKQIKLLGDCSSLCSPEISGAFSSVNPSSAEMNHNFLIRLEAMRCCLHKFRGE